MLALSVSVRLYLSYSNNLSPSRWLRGINPGLVLENPSLYRELQLAQPRTASGVNSPGQCLERVLKHVRDYVYAIGET